MAKNKVYLASHAFLGRSQATLLTDSPPHVCQFTLIAVAPTKKAATALLGEHLRYEREAAQIIRSTRVNDVFNTWRELVDQGVLALEDTGVYITENSAGRTLVRLDPGQRGTVLARCRRDVPESGPLGKLVWVKEG